MEREKKKNNSIILIILVILLMGACFYIGTQMGPKLDNKDKDNIKEENNIPEIKNEQLEQRLSISLIASHFGEIFVKKDGTVYYVKDTKINLKEEIGTLEEVNFDYYDKNMPICQSGNCPQKAYKLDLENIVGAYEIYFGNGENTKDVILLDKNGIVNNLHISTNSDGTHRMELKKDVFPNAKIVSVLIQNGFGANSAILVDSQGNQYRYNN